MTGNSNQRVYILVVNYKKWEDVVECLDSLLAQDHRNFSVIVIDNNSGNRSLDHLEDWADGNTGRVPTEQRSFCSRLTVENLASGFPTPVSWPPLLLVQNNENSGFAAANNIILRLLLVEDAYVWLLNPDMVVEKNTLSALVGFAVSSPRKSIIGSVVKSYWQPEKILFYGGSRINFASATTSRIGELRNIHRLDYVSGGSLFTHAANFRDIGLMPEDYFLYWEETDWCFEARKKDYKMLVCLDATCYDKISSVIGKSFLADYYYTRNGLRFIKKNSEKNIRGALALSLLRMLKRAGTGKWQRAKGMYKGLTTFLNKEEGYVNK